MATAKAVTESYPHIEKTPGVCGGKACIEGTRIRVLDIWGLHRRGYKPEKMLNVYAVPLTLAQVHAALAYAYDHPEEIEAALEADRRAEREIDRGRAEFFKKRRSAR
jgi:uncharacterized protein (DUF433 family)